jgi:hypothetical protein
MSELLLICQYQDCMPEEYSRTKTKNEILLFLKLVFFYCVCLFVGWLVILLWVFIFIFIPIFFLLSVLSTSQSQYSHPYSQPLHSPSISYATIHCSLPSYSFCSFSSTISLSLHLPLPSSINLSLDYPLLLHTTCRPIYCTNFIQPQPLAIPDISTLH